MEKSLILFVITTSLSFAGVTEKEKELAKTQEQIRQVSKSIKRINLQKGALIERLAVTEKKYGELIRSLKTLKKQINQKQQRLKALRNEIKAQQIEIDELTKVLAEQIRSAYAMGRQERLKLMLNQQDPALSSRMMVYYDYLNRDRMEKLQAVKEGMRKLGELEGLQILETERLEEIATQREIKKQKLAKTKSERNDLLAKLEKDVNYQARQLTLLKNDEKRIKRLIAGLQREMDDFPVDPGPAKPFAKLKGRLVWPIKGRLVKRFGSKRADSRWDGVLIDAREGTEIKAVSRGRVLYSDWLRGYGLLTIIDHGSGFMSLYAFNQSLFREVGNWVEAGDVIATVGKSGGRSQSGLYFGIRKQGKPVDPVKWCRKIRNGKIG